MLLHGYHAAGCRLPTTMAQFGHGFVCDPYALGYTCIALCLYATTGNFVAIPLGAQEAS